MRVLITGHKGFVGRHFYRHYDKLGATVVGIDIKGPGGMDCREFFNLDTGVFDLVIHCAAIVGGRATIEGKPLSVATDLSIDSELFQWVVQTKQPRVVYFSSSAAYPIIFQSETVGADTRLYEAEIDFDHIYKPDFTYGWTKLTGEYLAQYVNATSKSKVYVFRPFSGYGADQDLTYPFPSFLKRCHDKVDPFPIWGTGEQARDFIHISDIVALVNKVIAADYLRPVNICTGRRTTFNELAEIMFTACGWRPKEIQHLLDKPIGVMHRVGNPTMMETFHIPKYTLEEYIESMFIKIVKS